MVEGPQERAGFDEERATSGKDQTGYQRQTASEKAVRESVNDGITRKHQRYVNNRHTAHSGDFNDNGNGKSEVLRPPSKTLLAKVEKSAPDVVETYAPEGTVVSFADYIDDHDDKENRRSTPFPSHFNNGIESNGYQALWGNQADIMATDNEDHGRYGVHLNPMGAMRNVIDQNGDIRKGHNDQQWTPTPATRQGIGGIGDALWLGRGSIDAWSNASVNGRNMEQLECGHLLRLINDAGGIRQTH
ncbi:hypothetical protein FN846DRAFT_887106 [Sphaerosporella brunnea]|uniref:Uncharacterized protein n=1 Tax=Sphaerosporella brunnea TaxID=1250544 RepID=A0A5J5F7L1_9PEZI|nr:hypothetical protein FN846DRAFT_887106 [Sphaerosporella brunnea]